MMILIHANGISETTDMRFSAFLAASRELEFLDTATDSNGAVSFRFNDPQNRIVQLHKDFLAGEEAPANRLFAELLRMRRRIDAAQAKEQRNGR